MFFQEMRKPIVILLFVNTQCSLFFCQEYIALFKELANHCSSLVEIVIVPTNRRSKSR
jgi:hypothetical protein